MGTARASHSWLSELNSFHITSLP